MDQLSNSSVIGYAVFDRFEECYEYNENACYIADSVDSAQGVLRRSLIAAEDGRIDPVSFDDIMNDFGCSCGEYAMEVAVFVLFEQLAQIDGVSFTSEPYAGMDDLLVVQVDGVKRQED